MLKINYVICIKKLFFPFIFMLFTICLIIFSKSNLQAVQNGLNLWATSVVPSLFPFFVATELLSHTDFIDILGRRLNFIMKPLFNIRGQGCFAFIMGMISGYPIGAKIAVNLMQTNTCTKTECERLLSFTNNSGPLFIIGTIGISMFGNTTIGILLFITHILASITVGICFRFYNPKPSTKKLDKAEFFVSSSSTKNNLNSSLYFSSKKNQVNLSNLGGIIGESIYNAISTILLVGGFIVLFSVIISILNSSNIFTLLSNIFMPITNWLHISPNFIKAFFTGLIEITNGINQTSLIPCKLLSVNIILSSFLLGFGGFSILLQVWSVISKAGLSIKPYLLGKLLHGIFAMLYTFLLIYFLPIFQFDLYA
jgi:sporulation integral membrane protein YlbJ